jgi:hypothetical protein
VIEFPIAAAAAALAGYSVFVERTALGLTRLDLTFSRLPRSFDGFRVLQLADLHIAHWGKLERRMEEMLRGQSIDLVALTGDIAVRSKGARLLREFLSRLRLDDRTYGVFGNTEHKGEYGRRRREDLSREALRVLTNEHVVIDRDGERIVLVGVDDPFTGLDDLARALAGAPADAFKVLLAHAPSVAGDAAQAGIDLVLSGHTHGGQIRFPLVGAVFTHLRKYKRLVEGLFEGPELARILGTDPGEMRIYVSRGVGISNLPARFLCPPEIVLVTLRCAACSTAPVQPIIY